MIVSDTTEEATLTTVYQGVPEGGLNPFYYPAARPGEFHSGFVERGDHLTKAHSSDSGVLLGADGAFYVVTDVVTHDQTRPMIHHVTLTPVSPLDEVQFRGMVAIDGSALKLVERVLLVAELNQRYRPLVALANANTEAPRRGGYWFRYDKQRGEYLLIPQRGTPVEEAQFLAYLEAVVSG